MNTHTHTPGPWSAAINSRPLYTSAEIYGPPNGFGMVAEIRTSFGTDDEKAANARLIASAPDLLQVAKDFLLLAQLHDWEGAAIEFAKVTLAKAEGRA